LTGLAGFEDVSLSSLRTTTATVATIGLLNHWKEGRGFDIPTRRVGATQQSMHPSPALCTTTIHTLPSHFFLVEAAQVQISTQTAAAADAMDREGAHLR
jgi:hypothetical protein